jgi:hypothetical protein
LRGTLVLWLVRVSRSSVCKCREATIRCGGEWTELPRREFVEQRDAKHNDRFSHLPFISVRRSTWNTACRVYSRLPITIGHVPRGTVALTCVSECSSSRSGYSSIIQESLPQHTHPQSLEDAALPTHPMAWQGGTAYLVTPKHRGFVLKRTRGRICWPLEEARWAFKGLSRPNTLFHVEHRQERNIWAGISSAPVKRNFAPNGRNTVQLTHSTH